MVKTCCLGVTHVPPGWKLIGETEHGLTFYNWITHELSYLGIDRTDPPQGGTFPPVFIKPRVPDGGETY